MGVTELCRLEMALTTVNRRQGGQTADSKVLRLAELTEEDLYGFYPAEHYEGSSFRWSRPTAAVRLALKPVDCRLTLHMLSVRKINPRKDTFFFLNGHRFDDASAVHDGSALRLRLRAAYFNAGDPWLIIMCPPWHRLRRSRRDRRELGMPLKKISITVD